MILIVVIYLPVSSWMYEWMDRQPVSPLWSQWEPPEADSGAACFRAVYTDVISSDGLLQVTVLYL